MLDARIAKSARDGSGETLRACPSTNNPQHIRVPANEMFATSLAQWFGLPVPRVEVVEVSDWLIKDAPGSGRGRRATTLCSSGKQLGSKYPDPGRSIFDYLQESLLSHITNLGDFAQHARIGQVGRKL